MPAACGRTSPRRRPIVAARRDHRTRPAQADEPVQADARPVIDGLGKRRLRLRRRSWTRYSTPHGSPRVKGGAGASRVSRARGRRLRPRRHQGRGRGRDGGIDRRPGAQDPDGAETRASRPASSDQLETSRRHARAIAPASSQTMATWPAPAASLRMSGAGALIVDTLARREGTPAVGGIAVEDPLHRAVGAADHGRPCDMQDAGFVDGQARAVVGAARRSAHPSSLTRTGAPRTSSRRRWSGPRRCRAGSWDRCAARRRRRRHPGRRPPPSCSRSTRRSRPSSPRGSRPSARPAWKMSWRIDRSRRRRGPAAPPVEPDHVGGCRSRIDEPARPIRARRAGLRRERSWRARKPSSPALSARARTTGRGSLPSSTTRHRWPIPMAAWGACSRRRGHHPPTSFTRVGRPKSRAVVPADGGVDVGRSGTLAAQVDHHAREPDAARRRPLFVAPSTARRTGSAQGRHGRAADAPPSMSTLHTAATTRPRRTFHCALRHQKREAQAETGPSAGRPTAVICPNVGDGFVG